MGYNAKSLLTVTEEEVLKHRFGLTDDQRYKSLEEVGRIDAEKSNRNRRAEKKRVVSELNKGYRGGGVAKKGKGVAL